MKLESDWKHGKSERGKTSCAVEAKITRTKGKKRVIFHELATGLITILFHSVIESKKKKSDIYSYENVPDYFFRLQFSLVLHKMSWKLNTDIFPLGELSLFTARCLPSQRVYSLSLGLLLFNYSFHLADGDSVRFHQHLGSFSCPCFALHQRQTVILR